MSRHSRKAVLEYLAIGIAKATLQRQAPRFRRHEFQLRTLKASQIVDSRWADHAKERIAADMGAALLKNDFIKWETKNCSDNPIMRGKIIIHGTLEVVDRRS